MVLELAGKELHGQRRNPRRLFQLKGSRFERWGRFDVTYTTSGQHQWSSRASWRVAGCHSRWFRPNWWEPWPVDQGAESPLAQGPRAEDLAPCLIGNVRGIRFDTQLGPATGQKRLQPSR